MGMDIDDARHQCESLRIDNLVCAPAQLAYLCNAALTHGHVRIDRRRAAAVENLSTANQEIHHGWTLSQVGGNVLAGRLSTCFAGKFSCAMQAIDWHRGPPLESAIGRS